MLRMPRRKPSIFALRLAAAGAVALLAGACESPVAYQQVPAWRLQATHAAPPQNDVAQARDEAREGERAADRKYEYRGGRDPKTGRANIQM
jgi:hypothetical protein